MEDVKLPNDQLASDQEDSDQGPNCTLAAEGAGVTAAGATAFSAVDILQSHLASSYWAGQMSQGMWPLMTPQQQQSALLYYDNDFWKAKLGFVQWAPYAIPAVALLPGMADRFAGDLQTSIAWLPQRKSSDDVWETMHGAQTQRYDSKVIRLVSTVSLFALGAASVAAGGIGSSAFLAKFAALLDSSAFCSALGIGAGGTYGGFAGQQSAKHGLGLWHKLRSGLPFNVINELTREQEQEICSKLSLYYFSHRFLSWLNKLRIRLATGDSYLPAKAWIAADHANDANKNPICVNEKFYRIDRRLHTYRGTGSFLGLVTGTLLGYFFLGPIGAIIFGYIGYRLGRAIGARASYHQNLFDGPTKAQGINQAVYEHLEHIKYKLLRQNIITHLYNSYFKRAYENFENSNLRLIKTALGGAFALLLDSLKLLFIWPLTMLRNGWQYLSVRTTWSLIQKYIGELKGGYKAAKEKSSESKLENEYNEAKEESSKSKFVLREIAKAFLSIIIGLLKLPKVILGAFFAILNPFTQTEYFAEKQQLEHEKKCLKTELNNHTLFPENHNTHVKRYRAHIDEHSKAIPVDNPTPTCWQNVIGFFGVRPSDREKHEQSNYKLYLAEVISKCDSEIKDSKKRVPLGLGSTLA